MAYLCVRTGVNGALHIGPQGYGRFIFCRQNNFVMRAAHGIQEHIVIGRGEKQGIWSSGVLGCLLRGANGSAHDLRMIYMMERAKLFLHRFNGLVVEPTLTLPPMVTPSLSVVCSVDLISTAVAIYQ